MKNMYIILISFILLCSGCNEYTVAEQEEAKPIEKVTECFYYKSDSFFPDTSSVLYSIYHNETYEVEKEIVIFSYNFHTLEEAIENYEFHQKTCDENNKYGILFCQANRDNKNVSNIYYDYNVDYDYKEKIKELENQGYECSEKNIN